MKKKYVFISLCALRNVKVKMCILKKKGKFFYRYLRKCLFYWENPQYVHQLAVRLLVVYVRKLAFLFYQYEGRYEMFYHQTYRLLEQEIVLGEGKKILCEMVNVYLDGIWDKLKKKHKELKEEELEFMCLLAAGFHPSELAIIFGWKRVESVYVKSSRLGKRLQLNVSLVEYLQTYRPKG